MTPPITLIRALVGFELARRRNVVSTYVYALVLFAAGFFMMLAAGGVFSGVAVSTGNERVLINGPHSLFTSIGVISLFGLFTVAAIFGQAAYQDFGHDTWSIIFTKNVRKTPYLAGRFLGAYVVGANVRGATMTSESMAQYSALMVMKKKFGKERMRRFLKFELDGYLRGRFGERKKELPLAHNENQTYIHYQKGSVAMWALQDYIGEDRVNRALASVVSTWRQKGPPYATSKDIVDAFRAETPPEYQYLIDDLFETITLYDNRTLSAKATKNADGSYEVVLHVFAKKVRSDDKGEERELDFEDFIDVGALDELGTAIMTEKRRIRKGESEIRIVVPKKPAKVGVDPLNGLVDRDSDDNVVSPTF